MASEREPRLFSEPSFRLGRGSKRSPSLNFARVRRAGVVESLSSYFPMRFVPIGKPHVHHERMSVFGAFDPIRARLWFQSHRDESHFPNLSGGGENLRLEGISAFRSRRRSCDRHPGLNGRQADSFRATSAAALATERSDLSRSSPGRAQRRRYRTRFRLFLGQQLQE
jgi:hypothetical protein